METFLEYETMCREPPSGHVFVERLAEIDPKKVAEVVRRSRDKKTMPLRPIFSRCLRNPSRFRGKRARLSLFRPQPHLPSFHLNPSTFARFISENDVPDHYNNIADKNM